MKILIESKTKKIVCRRYIEQDKYLTSISPFEYKNNADKPKSGVYGLKQFMEALELNFSKQIN